MTHTPGALPSAPVITEGCGRAWRRSRVRCSSLPDTRADLALCEHDVGRDGDELVVSVHNIGAAHVPAGIPVVARDDGGEETARTEPPAVPAPVDCAPSSVDVRLLVAGVASMGIDPNDAVAEITEVNNEAAAP